VISIADAFAVTEVLQQANAASLVALAARVQIKQKRKGEQLFRDKETVSTIYIVVSGLVALFKINSQGEKKVIFVLGQGKMVNEIILQDLPASVNCEIFEDAQILCFNKQDLLDVMEHDFALTKAVIDSLSLKTRRMYRQLKNTSNSVRGDKRLAAKLWKLSGDYGAVCKSGICIDIDLSITYLADMLGSQRETVSRQLKTLTEQGIVVIEQGRFVIVNRDELARIFKSP